jgi:hypothetical protein
MKSAILIALFWVALANSLSASESPYVPKPEIMRIFIGGYEGPSYEVLYDGRELKYYQASNMFDLKKSTPEIIPATNEDWAKFLKALDDMNAWAWKKKYINPSVKDGTTWNTTIVYNFANKGPITTYGSNSYPSGFDGFLSAVSALVGGRKFK